MKWALFVASFWCSCSEPTMNSTNITTQPTTITTTTPDGIFLEQKFRNIQRTLDLLRGHNEGRNYNSRDTNAISPKGRGMVDEENTLFGSYNSVYSNSQWGDTVGSGDGEYEYVNRSYQPVFPDDEDLFPDGFKIYSGSGAGPDFWELNEITENVSSALITPIDNLHTTDDIQITSPRLTTDDITITNPPAAPSTPHESQQDSPRRQRITTTTTVTVPTTIRLSPASRSHSIAPSLGIMLGLLMITVAGRTVLALSTPVPSDV